ncbi:MAG: hypothetical protein RLZZ511_3208 [Cyanobacteriota bacterium]
MQPLEGHVGILVGEGGFVNEHVGILSKGNRVFAEDRVGAVDELPANFRGAAEIRAVDDLAIFQGDRRTIFQFAVERAEGNAQGFGLFDIEGAGPIAFHHPVPIGRNPVLQQFAGNGKFVIFKHLSGFDRMDAQGIGEVSVGIAAAGFDIVMQIRGAVEINLVNIARETATGEESHQAKDVIAMHVGDEDAANLARSQVAFD